MSSPLEATLDQCVRTGITVYLGQTYRLDLFTLIQSTYCGENVLIAEQNLTAPNIRFHNVLRFSGSSLPTGLSITSAYTYENSGLLVGTPTVLGTSNVLVKVEMSDYFFTAGGGTDTNTVRATGFIIVPIIVSNSPTSLPAVTSVILPSSINAVKGVYLNFALSAEIATYPLYWSATGLPAGLNIEGSNIEGSPTETGTTSVVLTLRYKLTNNSAYISETKTISVVVTAAPVIVDGSSGTTFLGTGGIDVFLDLQSMALSLDLPKTESVIAEGSTIVNATLKQFVVKPSQILDINVRFIKGSTIVDPDPTSIRFGIGSKIGGPLLMLGNTFTKVGTGTSAHYKMRIIGDSNEFFELERDYFDEDSVEQVKETSDTQGGGTEPIAGICELEFTTGSGNTATLFRSDSLAVAIRRSLLAGI